MENKEEVMILEDSPEAATYRTDIKGWVSRTGLFLGDRQDSERLARYDGSTHAKCEKCGQIRRKNSWCETCHKLREKEVYEKMPKKKWDGEGMICCDGDRYFTSIEEAEDYAEDNGQTLADLQLVICEPQYAHEIEDDYWEDLLPEDMGLDEVYPELSKAIEVVNVLIRQKKVPLSYSAGKFALEL
jgi:hypothetical protein